MREFPSIVSYLVDAVDRSFPGRKFGNRSLSVVTGAQKSIAEFLATEPTSATAPTVFVSFNGYQFPDPRENKSGAKSREYTIIISAGIPAASSSRSRTSNSELVSDAEMIADAIADVINSDEGFRVDRAESYRQGIVTGGRNLFLTLGIDAFAIDVFVF